MCVFDPAVGGLTILETERKLVSTEVWTKLRAYFSKAPEFTQNQEPCQQCLVSKTLAMSVYNCQICSKI